MSNAIKKTIIASVAALALGLGVVASTEPAAAQHRYGGGGHWGGGHWGGGGWRGGWGPGLGLGIVGGLAAGAIIASQAPYYGGYYGGYPYGYGYGGYPYGYGGCVRYRPIYDQWGNYLGQRAVNACY
jgi:hypothetical protein